MSVSHWLELGWSKLESSSIGLGVDLDIHLQALSWGVAIVIFGFIVLAYDTRDNPHRPSFPVRDHYIMGLEQRYFLVILNGFLLYGSLAVFLQINHHPMPT